PRLRGRGLRARRRGLACGSRIRSGRSPLRRAWPRRIGGPLRRAAPADGGRRPARPHAPAAPREPRVTRQLWAPWRLEYIQAADEQPGCVFCLAAAGDDEERFVVRRGERAFVLLNKFPYSSGHLMIAPNRH